jgi:hypothetical protein
VVKIATDGCRRSPPAQPITCFGPDLSSSPRNAVADDDAADAVRIYVLWRWSLALILVALLAMTIWRALLRGKRRPRVDPKARVRVFERHNQMSADDHLRRGPNRSQCRIRGRSGAHMKHSRVDWPLGSSESFTTARHSRHATTVPPVMGVVRIWPLLQSGQVVMRSEDPGAWAIGHAHVDCLDRTTRVITSRSGDEAPPQGSSTCVHAPAPPPRLPLRILRTVPLFQAAGSIQVSGVGQRSSQASLAANARARGLRMSRARR